MEKPKRMTKEVWSSILSASELTEEGMRNWHINFEKEAPEQHKAFLQYLQIFDEEIKQIRSWTFETVQKSKI